MTTSRSLDSERGTALLIVLLMLTLALALVGGFVTTLMTDQQLRGVDQSRTRVFYAAHGALERLTADLGNLFLADSAPSSAEVNALTVNEPVFNRVVFEDLDGGTGYQITYPQMNGSPVAQNRIISSGPLQGFTGLMTPYTLAVTARSAEATSLSSEVRLERTLQTVAIPLFQFGVFSESDLSYFPGPNFNFGGRVHTNGNLFLAVGNGATLTLGDRVTAVGEVIRTHLSNGFDNAVNYPGTVSVARAPGDLRALARTEGSLVNTLGSAQREPGWTNTSITDYNGYLRNGRTGARRLDLPFLSLGATPIDLIRRGVTGEAAGLLNQRYYKLASLRILLSDTAADLTGLPGVTPNAPLPLGGTAAAPVTYALRPMALSGGYPTPNPIQLTAALAANANNPTTLRTLTVNTTAGLPTAPAGAVAPHVLVTVAGVTSQIRCTGRTATTLTGCLGTPVGGIPINTAVNTDYRSPFGTPLLDGFIKIELQRADETWVDVTTEILGLGVTAANATCTGANDPSPSAVIRIQRLRDDPSFGCNSTSPYDYWPNTLYDTREANLRDNLATTDLSIRLGGVMHYVELDVNNLRRWFLGQIGAAGPNARSVNGYTVYFSDRRTNRDLANLETAEYGFEDFVNPADANGTPNNALDDGEDVNVSGTLQTYGRAPQLGALAWAAPYAAAIRPWSTVTVPEARNNRPIFFRRGLKLVNGTLGNLPTPGFTMASENPVYVQGNFNANGAGFGEPNSATAVIADAVTFLSNAWSDVTSFAAPNNPAGRNATTTWYRTAILSGKGRSFPRPAAGAPGQDFGTDGGVHNFLRYIEDWSGETLNYRGSIASFFFSRQAVGTFKCCTNVYSPPTRGYTFDIEFLDPNLLPPFTPMFRDVNTTGFTQVIR